MAIEEKNEGPVTLEELRSILQTQKPVSSVKTWKPTTGGILSIVSGYLNILTGIFMTIGLPFYAGVGSFVGVGTGFGILLIIAGIISILGGIAAITRRAWRLALAGSITALFPSFVIVPGVLSLIFITLGKSEFKRK